MKRESHREFSKRNNGSPGVNVIHKDMRALILY